MKLLIHHSLQYVVINKRSITVFLTVGLLSAFIYFLTFTGLWKVLHFNYQVAVSIGYICSVIFHFIANRYYTFKSGNQKILGHLVRYLMMTLFNYIITLIIMYFIVEKLKLSPYIGIVISIASTVNIGYFMSRYWVFQPSI